MPRAPKALFKSYTFMQFSLIQLLYVTLAITGIILNTRQRTLAWPVALLSTGLSLYVYYSVGLYSK